MKKLGAIALLLSLGMFTLGCEKAKDAGGDAGAGDTTTDTTTDDTGADTSGDTTTE